jgi:UDP-glucuronate 4-epimerase
VNLAAQAGVRYSIYSPLAYIDDIVEDVTRVLNQPAAANPAWQGNAPDPGTSTAPWSVYNIGNNQPVELMDYISALEKALGKTASASTSR